MSVKWQYWIGLLGIITNTVGLASEFIGKLDWRSAGFCLVGLIISLSLYTGSKTEYEQQRRKTRT